jgi:hypothetical protein
MRERRDVDRLESLPVSRFPPDSLGYPAERFLITSDMLVVDFKKLRMVF